MKKFKFIIFVLIISVGFSLNCFGNSSASNDNCFLKIYKNNKTGLIDINGNTVIQPQYQDIGTGFSNDRLSVKKNNKWGFVDKTFHEVIEPRYDQVSLFRNGWCSVKVGDDWGMIDTNGTLIVKPIYRTIDFDTDEKVAIVKQGDKYGLIDETGKLLIPINYDNLHFLANDLLSFNIDSKAGIIRKTGQVLFTIQNNGTIVKIDGSPDNIGLYMIYYDEIDGTNSFLHYAGVIDKSGKILVPVKYHEIHYDNGIIVYTDYYNCGLISVKDNKVLQPVYKEINSYLSDEFIVSKDYEHYGTINAKGEEKIKPIYTYLQKLGNNLLVNSGGKWESSSLQGSRISGGKWGVIDKRGKIIIPLKYEDAYAIKDYACIKENGLWGLINSEGRILAKPQYFKIDISSQNYGNDPFLILHYSKGQIAGAGFIDKNGKPISKSLYPFQNADEYYKGLASVEINNKWGFINASGKIVIKCQYDGCYSFDNGVCWVYKIIDGKLKYGLINKKGTYLYYPVYDNMNFNYLVNDFDN